MKKKFKSYYGYGNGRLAYFVHRLGINWYGRNIVMCFPKRFSINEPVDVTNFGSYNYIEFEIYEDEVGDFGNHYILNFLR